jgi:hypothetical protein
VALREKNQDQVKEILQRGTEKLSTVSADWRRLADELQGRQAPGGREGAGQTGRRSGMAQGGPSGRRGPGGSSGAESPGYGQAELPPEVFGQPAAGDRNPPAGPAGAATAPVALNELAPIAVPTDEPTVPAERRRLEEDTRTRLRALYQPYLQLRRSGVDMQPIEQLVRLSRDALNKGALCHAAVDVNAVADMMWRLLAPAGAEPPTAQQPDRPAPAGGQ